MILWFFGTVRANYVMIQIERRTYLGYRWNLRESSLRSFSGGGEYWNGLIHQMIIEPDLNHLTRFRNLSLVYSSWLFRKTKTHSIAEITRNKLKPTTIKDLNSLREAPRASPFSEYISTERNRLNETGSYLDIFEILYGLGLLFVAEIWTDPSGRLHHTGEYSLCSGLVRASRVKIPTAVIFSEFISNIGEFLRTMESADDWTVIN